MIGDWFETLIKNAKELGFKLIRYPAIEPPAKPRDCDCGEYKFTWPTGKGPCVICGSNNLPIYLVKSNPTYQPLCKTCHDNPDLHSILLLTIGEYNLGVDLDA